MDLDIISDQWKEFVSPQLKFNKGDIKYELIPNLNEYKDRQEDFFINAEK